MLRTDDPTIGTSSHEQHERSRNGPDRSPEVDTKPGMTREAALLEMEKFLDISEYEIRKVMGQGSPLPQSSGPDHGVRVPSEHAEEPSDAPRSEKHDTTQTVDASPQEAAAIVQPSSLEQAAPREN